MKVDFFGFILQC